MVRDVPSPARLEDLDTAARQLIARQQDVLRVGAPAEGHHRLVLEQEKGVPDGAADALVEQLLLQCVRVAVTNAPEPVRREASQGALQH